MNEILFEVTVKGEVNQVTNGACERARDLFGAKVIAIHVAEDDCYRLEVKKRIHYMSALQAVGAVSNMVQGIFWDTSWRTAEISCVEAPVEEATGVQ